MTMGGSTQRLRTPEEVRQELLSHAKLLIAHLEGGCHDHACELVEPGPGMHTNGGCRCWEDVDQILGDAHSLAKQLRSPGVARRCW